MAARITVKPISEKVFSGRAVVAAKALAMANNAPAPTAAPREARLVTAAERVTRQRWRNNRADSAGAQATPSTTPTTKVRPRASRLAIVAGWAGGESPGRAAVDALVPDLYRELRRMAQWRLGGGDQTLQATGPEVAHHSLNFRKLGHRCE